VTPVVTVALEPFARETLERYVEAGYNPRSFLRTAIAYYLSQVGADRRAWRVPQFLEGRPAKGAPLRVDLDDGTWRGLVDAAAAQGVSLGRLARHALLFFLADLDAGRVRSRRHEPPSQAG
jgi:hypothetical protein